MYPRGWGEDYICDFPSVDAFFSWVSGWWAAEYMHLPRHPFFNILALCKDGEPLNLGLDIINEHLRRSWPRIRRLLGC